MARYLYLDASALVKLAVSEPETAALEREVLNCDGIFSSVVAATELTRAIARGGRHEAADHAESVLDSIFLAEFTPVIRDLAGRLSPSSLRTLDAIHVATAASLDLPDLTFITYDDRQANAARALGLHVAQPGRS